MRTLPSALATAQRSRSRRPYLKVEIASRFPYPRTLIWTNLYSGAEADTVHAAAVSSDRYMTRLRVDGTNLYRQRVDPSADSPPWSSWTLWGSSARLCAIAQNGLNIWAFQTPDAAPAQVYLSTSTDGGQSFSGWSLVFTHTSTIAYIAASAKTNTDLCVIVNDGTEIAAYRRLSAVWQAKVVSSITCTITGLSVQYEADWNVIATGDDGTDAFVGRLLFGDGYSQAVATWSSLVIITSATLTANIAYSAPFYAYPDIHRVTFRETYSGTVAYDRIMLTAMPAISDFVNDTWREPIPYTDAQPYGLAITAHPNAALLTSANHVDSAPLNLAAVDVTDDVLSADLHDTDLHHPSESTIVLDNAHGRYDVLGSGDNIALRKGAQVRASPGYYTPDHATYAFLTSTGPTWWIVGLDHNYPKKGGSATVTLHIADTWSFLARWTSPTNYIFPATKNIFQIWSFLLARLGFEGSSISSSGAFSSLYPNFTVTAGTTMLTALRRLMALVPDVLMPRLAFLYLRYPQASDASQAPYAYHHDPATQHEISAADYHDTLKDANHQRVFGGPLADILGEALDLDDIALFYASARHHADPNLTTGSEATDRAETEQRRLDIPATDDRIITPVHCGLELYDVIDLTDARIGLSAVKRRVLALHTVYRRDRPSVYDHHVTLGAP